MQLDELLNAHRAMLDRVGDAVAGRAPDPADLRRVAGLAGQRTELIAEQLEALERRKQAAIARFDAQIARLEAERGTLKGRGDRGEAVAEALTGKAGGDRPAPVRRPRAPRPAPKP